MDTVRTPQQQLGDWAEQCANYHAQQQGFRLITQNYHCRGGELDLILVKNQLLVFMEVKARSNQHYGLATEMLTTSKQKKMMIAIQHFLQHYPEYANYDYRFDLFAIQFQYSTQDTIHLLQQHRPIPYTYEWIEHAFLWQD